MRHFAVLRTSAKEFAPRLTAGFLIFLIFLERPIGWMLFIFVANRSFGLSCFVAAAAALCAEVVDWQAYEKGKGRMMLMNRKPSRAANYTCLPRLQIKPNVNCSKIDQNLNLIQFQNANQNLFTFVILLSLFTLFSFKHTDRFLVGALCLNIVCPERPDCSTRCKAAAAEGKTV